MSMKRPAAGILLPLLITAAFPAICRAQGDVGAGIGISPWESQSLRKEKKPKPVDPYVKAIARRFQINETDLAALSARGYGRNELIKILLIVRKSGKDIRDIVRQRDHRARLSALAAKYSIDYPMLLTEAETVRKEIDYSVAASSAAPSFEVRTSSSGIIIAPHHAVSSSTAPSDSTP